MSIQKNKYCTKLHHIINKSANREKLQNNERNTLCISNLNKLYVDRANHSLCNPITQKIDDNIKENIFIFKKNNIAIKQQKLSSVQQKNRNTILPDLNLLECPISNKNKMCPEDLKKISYLLETKLSEYRISANVVNIISGPVITRFELNLSPGVKSSKVSNLSCDLARSLSLASVRIVEIIPGTPYVGLEIPNIKRNIVYLYDIINSDDFQKINTPLSLILGQNPIGLPIIADLRCMPHLLIAGATGSGKSIGINAMIVGILYKSTPEEVRFIMIDPKMLELSIYESIPHLLKQVITDMQDVDAILKWCVQEMEHRYKLMTLFKVKNLENYNHQIDQKYYTNNSENDFVNQYYNNNKYATNASKKLPYIIIIIDEFSDLILTATKQIEILILRLTQKSRAAGIHLILATQRPSVNVITGLIKANIPARIAFTVSSKIDSRTILGQSGAESLLGMGDMLYLPPNDSVPIRVHGVCIKDKEINAVVNFWKNKVNS